MAAPRNRSRYRRNRQEETEGGFFVLFQGIFPPVLLGCAMILSRLASFYVPLVVSGLGFLTMKNDAN